MPALFSVTDGTLGRPAVIRSEQPIGHEISFAFVAGTAPPSPDSAGLVTNSAGVPSAILAGTGKRLSRAIAAAKVAERSAICAFVIACQANKVFLYS